MNKIFQQIKDFFGEDNEIIKSTEMSLKERLTSPFLGYFITSWILFNWRILYVAFFVSQDNILKQTTLLRYDYLSRVFPVLYSLDFLLHFFVYPFLMTIFFFWIFPFITRPFFKKYIRNQKKLKIIEIKETTEKVKLERELIVEERRTENEIKKTETDWKRDYDKFRESSNLFSQFEQIIQSIYQRGGSIKNEYGNVVVNKEILAYADTTGLISISGTMIKLTSKGKYFVSLFTINK